MNSAVGSGVLAVISNAGYFLGGRGLNLVVRFCYAILLTRFLGPELYGYLAYGISWYLAFLPLTSLGLDVILSRRIGKDPNNGSQVVSQTFTLKMAACVVAAFACGFLGCLTEVKPELERLLIIFSFALFGRSIAVWVDFVFAAYEKMKFALRLSALFRPLEVAAGLVVLFSGGGIVFLAAVQALSWWIQAIWGLVLIRRVGIEIRFSKDLAALKLMFLRGLPIMAGAVMINWMVQGPLVIYRRLSVDSEGLGHFALAIQLFLVLSHIPLALNVAALPALSRSVVRKDGKEIYYVGVVIRTAIILGTCVGLVGLFSGPWLVRSIFGNHFASSGDLLSLSVWLIVPWTCGSAVLRVFFAQGKYYAQVLCAGVGSVAMLLGMSFLVSRFGASGAVAATGVGMILWSLCLLGLLYHTGVLDIWSVLAKPLVVGALAVGIYTKLLDTLYLLALPASLAFLVLLTVLWDIVTTEERNRLLEVIRTIIGR